MRFLITPFVVIALIALVFRRRAPAVSLGLVGGVLGLFLSIPLAGVLGPSGFVLGFLGGSLAGVVVLGEIGLDRGRPTASPLFLRWTAVLVAIGGFAATVAISVFFLDICGSDPADAEFVCQAPFVPLALVVAQPVAFVFLLIRSTEQARVARTPRKDLSDERA